MTVAAVQRPVLVKGDANDVGSPADHFRHISLCDTGWFEKIDGWLGVMKTRAVDPSQNDSASRAGRVFGGDDPVSRGRQPWQAVRKMASGKTGA